MKRKLLFPLLAAAAAAVFALMPWASAPPEPSPPAVADSTPERVPTAASVTPAEAEASSETKSDNDSGVEIVHGMRVRKDRDCTIEPRYFDLGEGTVLTAHVCVPNGLPEPEFYDIYDDATLAKMAYSDAGAAEELGRRVSEQDPERARALILRSVALRPENTLPVLWLADQNYSMLSKNGEPAFKQMQEKYLLTRVAEELGSVDAAMLIRHELEEAGASEDMFRHLEHQVLFDLREIRAIQIEVKGESDLPDVSL